MIKPLFSIVKIKNYRKWRYFLWKKKIKEKIKRQNRLETGEGSLYKSQALNCYIFQYHNTLGKRQTLKQKKNENIKDFKARVTKIKNELNTGTFISKSDDTLLQILEHHIEQKLEDGIIEEVSYKRDMETLEQIKKCCSSFINKPIQKVIVEDIENSKMEIREYSKSCIDKIWRLLNRGFKIAYSRRKIQYNIMEDETLTKPISKVKISPILALSVQEQEKLCLTLKNCSNSKYASIALLQLYTGARIGEILALSKDCIDLSNNTLTIYRTLSKNKENKVILGKHTKTFDKKTGIDKGKRTFPMQPAVKKLITNILNEKITNIHGLLFWDYNNDSFIKYYEINSFLRTLNHSNNICNFSLSTHNLRHTFITRCQEKGMPLVVLQSLVGHVEGSNITNDIYTSVSLDFMKQELKKIN